MIVKDTSYVSILQEQLFHLQMLHISSKICHRSNVNVYGNRSCITINNIVVSIVLFLSAWYDCSYS